MKMFECTEEDIKIAAIYFNIYMTMRRRISMGDIDREDVEDYLSYKEATMTELQKDIAMMMVTGVAEELAKNIG